MSKTNFYIIAVIAALVVIASFVLVLSRGGGDTKGILGSDVVPAPQIAQGILLEVPAGDTFTIGTDEGIVEVKNFYRVAERITGDTTVVIEEKGAYFLAYDTAEGAFTVAFLEKPTPEILRLAEDSLLRKLGISQEEACKLDVNVHLPFNVGGLKKGISNLSFCHKAFR